MRKNRFISILVLSFAFCVFPASCIVQGGIPLWRDSFAFSFAQDDKLVFSLDVKSETIALPEIFKPTVDLSGRGVHKDETWPQMLASEGVLSRWEQDIGFAGPYRIQFNLWKIQEIAKDKERYAQLMGHYESLFKKVTDAGGIVVLDIFGTPAGLGNVLDRRSAPADMRAYKALVKEHMRYLSCEKKYNIWYEVWSAPDLDSFFLGRKQEYLNIYRAVAESAKELEAAAKINIPVGGPSISWWFQDFDGNSIVSPENSLIYELIRFCSRYRLPLDFISWHAYSTDPKAERELTRYRKNVVGLVRDWLDYFGFDRQTALIIDEWNYDNGLNVASERGQQSYIAASYCLSRLRYMYESGVDYQLYFCLEDFFDTREGVVRNIGLFWFDPQYDQRQGSPKLTYGAFRMLAKLNPEMFVSSLDFNDEFVGALATRSEDTISIIVYNYIDPEIGSNFIARNIGTLSNAERKIVLSLAKSGKLRKILAEEDDINAFHLTKRIKEVLKRGQELRRKAVKYKAAPRNFVLALKKLGSTYSYEQYTIDSESGLTCEFQPRVVGKEIPKGDYFEETLNLPPYSATMIILKKITQPIAEAPVVSEAAVPAAEISQGNQTVEGPANVTTEEKNNG